MGEFKVGEYVHQTHWSAGKEYKIIDTRGSGQIRVQEDGCISSWYSAINFYAVLPKTKFEIGDIVHLTYSAKSYEIEGKRIVRRENTDLVSYTTFYNLVGRGSSIAEDQLTKVDRSSLPPKLDYEIASIAGCP